jgi:hypothetical protein
VFVGAVPAAARRAAAGPAARAVGCSWVSQVSRLGTILEGIASDDPGTVFDRLCVRCSEELAVSGAGVALIVDGVHRGTLGASDDRIRAIEDLQFTFGEGPCLDANRTSRPVSAGDLASAGGRWPAFAPAAVDGGVGAVFAFPLLIGGARFGAFDLYCDTAGALTPQDYADAVIVADAASQLVLAVQAEAPDGELHEVIAGVTDHRAVVYQASGIVAVQLDISVEEALVRIRGHAYRTGIAVGSLAEDIVSRRVRLERDR